MCDSYIIQKSKPPRTHPGESGQIKKIVIKCLQNYFFIVLFLKMKKALTVLLMTISSLIFSGCLGFSVMCVQDTNVETMELEITSLRIHYVTQYGEIIEIYEYKKKEEKNADSNAS